MLSRLTCVAFAAAVAAVAAGTGPAAADEKKPVQVRPLKLTGLRFMDTGQQVTVLKSTADVEKAAGKSAADQVAKLVNFDKEDVVLVRWTSSGPPFDSLEYEVKGNAVEFYLKDPTKGGIRGQALRLGADFFAVTKGATVTLRKALN